MKALTIPALALAIFIASLPAWATVSNERAAGILDHQGYYDPRFAGYRYLVCGGDLFVTKFVARAPDGEFVTGYVCCGLVQACTLRWEQ
ncbi:MAG TPA: hypothetical protein VGO53_16205 [Steroidobacteraceae bacterium]|jgi:hypothetical protein|nr:hypothetical protein [Steroidobacteraceae bacterium]